MAVTWRELTAELGTATKPMTECRRFGPGAYPKPPLIAAAVHRCGLLASRGHRRSRHSALARSRGLRSLRRLWRGIGGCASSTQAANQEGSGDIYGCSS